MPVTCDNPWEMDTLREPHNAAHMELWDDNMSEQVYDVNEKI